jgi:cell division protein FtsW (lipid II flippase)
MKIRTGWLGARSLERVFLVLAGIMLSLLFIRLFQIERTNLKEVDKRLSEGSMVNLNAPQQGEHIRSLLQTRYYLEDPADIDYASRAVANGFSDPANGGAPIDNIGELNKDRFDVSATDAWIKGGDSYKKRAKLSRYLIGFTYEDSLLYDREQRSPSPFTPTVDAAMGKARIGGTVFTKADQPDPGVLVRLAMVVPEDSLYSRDKEDELQFVTVKTGPIRKVYLIDSSNIRSLQTVVIYARTDASGKYSFTGLPDGKAFEVLPLKPGFQFGPSKGIAKLEEEAAFDFVESPHTLKLFTTRDFNNLKKEKALIVRMPDEVIKWYWIIAVSFLASFFIIHLLLTFKFPQADQLILPVIMLLTGLSLLTLLSLQDPLRDRFLARSSFYYFLAGMGGILVMLLFDLRLFTPDSLLYRLFVFKGSKKAGNGWPWAIASALLLVLTILFGTGPEGSGVKVNLLGFQPSEVVKYLLIFFLAGFFAANEKFISEYTRWHKRWSFFWFSLIAILGVIFLFLLLGDLGPAMVCCFTFIILFSFSRGDFIYAVAGVVLYVLAIWAFKNIWIATAAVMAVLLLGAFFIKRGLSESAVMLLVVMAGFLLLDKIPYLAQLIPGPMQRLVDRKAIWSDPWNNEVFGGDHIANAIWGMTSGGVSGQGIGEGFAKTIPEAHTDMILPSLGEEFGWAGILCIFILFLIYLHRSIIIGRQTGRSFLFYLCAGIGIATFVQFLLIAGGSIGALPLSGVSLPFMSYGGSSLIVNMLAAGFLLSASNVKGSVVQMQYISKQQDRNLVPALIAALAGIVLLSVSISRYLFYSKKWVVRPALVADRSGARIFSYNPRIAILMNRLDAGTLYDRKGKILATSHPELIAKQKNTLVQTGIDPSKLQGLIHKRLDRYYPFAEQMFFWVGDMNTGIFMGGTNGYFGEYELMADLRGFATPATNYKVTATRFKEERFLPPRMIEMTVQKRDFSALADLLLAGINSREVAAFKRTNRDVQMTVDADLQSSLNNSLGSLDSLKSSRISVVVMDAGNGDVLASAAYPMAPIDEPDKMLLTMAEQNRLPYWITTSDIGFTLATQPGSTAKMITALAAFNKLGLAAKDKIIVVRPGDLIRTGGGEPDEAGAITIERGFVKSNNPFFIRLANEFQLQEEMAALYIKAGMFLHGAGGYYFEGDLTNTTQQQKWMELWRNTEFKSRLSYNKDNIRRTRGRGISGMAWGQGELIATPAAVARIAGAIANNGTMQPNRFVLKVHDSLLPLKLGIPIVNDPQYAAIMTDYMKKQSAGKTPRLGMVVAGKTGTPERIARGERINDGWYVFFAPKLQGTGYIVTCIRIEKCKGSGIAVGLAGTKIIPVLKEKGYIRSFEPVATAVDKTQGDQNAPADVPGDGDQTNPQPTTDSTIR